MTINNVLMTLGDFRFAISTAAYQQLRRTSEFVWASLGALLTDPSVSFTRIGDTNISLSGIILPYFVGGKGLEQLPMLEEMARSGKRYQLTSGRGDVFGFFGITRITEDHADLDKDGLPKKISFTVDLIRAGDNA